MREGKADQGKIEMSNNCQFCHSMIGFDEAWFMMTINWSQRTIEELWVCSHCGREHKLIGTPDSVILKFDPETLSRHATHRADSAAALAKDGLDSMIQSGNFTSVAQHFNLAFMEFGVSMKEAAAGFKKLSGAIKDFGNSIYGIPAEFALTTNRPVEWFDENKFKPQRGPVLIKTNISGGLEIIRQHLQK